MLNRSTDEDESRALEWPSSRGDGMPDVRVPAAQSPSIVITGANSIFSPGRIWMVILASSVGTMIEWYDFYIFGSLVTTLSVVFYPQGNSAFATIAYLS